MDALGIICGDGLVPGEEPAYLVRNPARPAETVVEAPSASPAQLDAAVAGAHRARERWSALAIEERLDAVTDAVANARARVESDDLASLYTQENGKPIAEAAGELLALDALAGLFGPMASEALADRVIDDDLGRTVVEHRPYGVVAVVLPFNAPVGLMATKVLSALLTGNAVVVKTPPTCPATTLRLLAAMNEALPPGVLNAVNGPAPELGATLVRHPGVELVSFTGSVRTGHAVLAAAAEHGTPVVLELGGNDAAIVAPDVEPDLDLATRILGAAFLNAGQICMAIKRVYVPRPALGDAIGALVEAGSSLVTGDGLAPEVTTGPVHTAAARTSAERLVDEARQGGGLAHELGTLRDEARNGAGYFVAPVVVADPPATSGLVREEQFAPALPVIGYATLDDAISAANDSEFGLCASVWSRDDELAWDVARRLEAGTVFFNGHSGPAIDFRAPFGGWKASGFGRELGPEGLRAMTHTRALIHRPL
jgi:acyl-CoA reductase-like NAD-dependent aldehyde dehydrogenase